MGEPQDRHGHLIADLVSSDGQLGPTLRAVYDTAGGASDGFLDALDAFVKSMDVEIERLCSKNYQGFIDSVDELLRVRRNAEHLQELIVHTNATIEESGAILVKTMEDLNYHRHVQRNILTAIEALSNCLPVIRLFGKAIAQLQGSKFYSTLRTLQDLETNRLPAVALYPFAAKIRERLPIMRQKVKQSTFAELQIFLGEIRTRAREIGETAMLQTTGASVVQASSSAGPNASTDLCASDQADFAPLYRCLHIYGMLGIRDECNRYYMEERQKQAQLVLQPLASMVLRNTLGRYRDFFYQVAGFFIVEDTVFSTAPDLLTRQWVEDLWELALTKISEVLRAQLAECTTCSTIFEVKELIVVFNQTLQGFGYNVGRLFDILLEVRERYTAVLVNQCTQDFLQILKQDNYTPLIANDEETFRDLLDRYPCDDPVLMEAAYPKYFPYSRAVPDIYTCVKKFIDDCLKFVEDLDLSHTDIDELIRRSVNRLLSKTLSATLSQVLLESSLDLQQLSQMSVNTTHLETACQQLESYITSLTHTLGDDLHITHLHGSAAFKDARTAAEQQILAVLQRKIDSFMELAEYDWAPPTARVESSEYIFDMLAYLTTIFASLTAMPVEVARMSYFSSCKYIAEQLITLFCNPDMKKINMNGIQNFALDVETCEQYAENCPLVATGDELFRSVFEYLRELVTLFLRWDWALFVDPAARAKSPYKLVQVSVALRLLEKLELSDGKGVFKFRSGEERKRKVEVVDIIKRLKAQMV